jgi:hypothetical protein
MALVDRDRLRAGPGAQLDAQAALADAGFAHHADDLRLATERVLQRGIERGRLPLAPDKNA